MNTFECEVYMFGSIHTVYINTDRTLEELENDWSLREELIIKEIVSRINVQEHLEQI